MKRYIKRQVIYTVSTLNRMGLNTESLRTAAGFVEVEDIKPAYDEYTEYLEESGVVDGIMTYTVKDLAPEVIGGKLVAVMTAVVDDLKIHTRRLVDLGYVSDALGTDHRYDSNTVEDKVNTLGVKMLNADLKFTCTDLATGIKDRRMHTADQLNTIYLTGITHIDTYQNLIWDAINEIKTKTNVANVHSVYAAYIAANPLP